MKKLAAIFTVILISVASIFASEAEVVIPDASILKNSEGNLEVVINYSKEISGIQLEMSFNPSQIQILEPGLSKSNLDFQVNSRINDGRLIMLVFSMTAGKLLPAEEKALVSFVEGGKKFVGIHSATVVDEENLKYIEMIGGRFINHSPHHEFTVKVADPGHPMVKGLKDFEIEDELYVLDRTPPAASVLLTAFWKDQAQPMLYLRAHGRGKVLYNALGHSQVAYENPNFKKIVLQGMEWLLR